MSTIINPWQIKTYVILKQLLADLFNDISEVKQISDEVGLARQEINWEQRVDLVWSDIIEQAHKKQHKAIKALVRKATREDSVYQDLFTILQKLINLTWKYSLEMRLELFDTIVELFGEIDKIRISDLLQIYSQVCDGLSTKSDPLLTQQKYDEFMKYGKAIWYEEHAIWCILEHLWELTQRSQSQSPIEQFVTIVLEKFAERISLTGLEFWLTTNRSKLQEYVTPQATDTNLFVNPVPLFIVIQSSNLNDEFRLRQDSNQYYISTHLFHADKQPNPSYTSNKHDENVQPTYYKNLQEEIFKIIEQVDKKQVISQIEFFVPFELLSEQFDQWLNPVTQESGVSLGFEYPVIVRFSKRMGQRHIQRWQQRWQRFRTLSREQCQEHVTLFTAQISGRRDLSDENLIAVGLAYDPDYSYATFVAIQEEGIPVAIWPRHPVCQDRSVESIAMAIQSALNCSLGDLPTHVYKLRRTRNNQANVLRDHLTLLWDDWDHQLPNHYYTDQQL